MSQLSRRVSRLAETKSVSLRFLENIDYEFPATDFDDCRFTGVLASPSSAFSGNFRSCTIHDLTCLTMTFQGADLLDCHISNCLFKNSNFESSHMAGCIVRDTTFRGVKITHINFGQNLFQGVIFDSCVFDTFVFKNCRFYNCEFISCQTKNHTFDTCFFDETQFDGFCVFPSTILLNVGLRSTHFQNTVFQSNREIVGGTTISEREFIDQIRTEAVGVQEKISSILFKGGGLEVLVHDVTEVLATNDHVSTAISWGFIEKLDLLIAQLNLLYTQNEILALNLLQLQDYLNTVSEKLTGTTDKLANQFRQQIDSLRLANSEYASQIIRLIEATHQRMVGAVYVELLGSESCSLAQFRDLFSDRTDVEVLEIRVRNSPVGVLVHLLEVGALIWIISIIVTSRFHYQIVDPNLISDEHSEVVEQERRSDVADMGVLVKDNGEDAHVTRSYEFGLISQDDMDFGVRIASAFQSGLAKKFELSFSPKRALEFQKNLLGLIRSYTKLDKSRMVE